MAELSDKIQIHTLGSEATSFERKKHREVLPEILVFDAKRVAEILKSSQGNFGSVHLDRIGLIELDPKLCSHPYKHILCDDERDLMKLEPKQRKEKLAQKGYDLEKPGSFFLCEGDAVVASLQVLNMSAGVKAIQKLKPSSAAASSIVRTSIYYIIDEKDPEELRNLQYGEFDPRTLEIIEKPIQALVIVLENHPNKPEELFIQTCFPLAASEVQKFKNEVRDEFFKKIIRKRMGYFEIDMDFVKTLPKTFLDPLLLKLNEALIAYRDKRFDGTLDVNAHVKKRFLELNLPMGLTDVDAQRMLTGNVIKNIVNCVIQKHYLSNYGYQINAVMTCGTIQSQNYYLSPENIWISFNQYASHAFQISENFHIGSPTALAVKGFKGLFFQKADKKLEGDTLDRLNSDYRLELRLDREGSYYENKIQSLVSKVEKFSKSCHEDATMSKYMEDDEFRKALAELLEFCKKPLQVSDLNELKKNIENLRSALLTVNKKLFEVIWESFREEGMRKLEATKDARVYNVHDFFNVDELMKLVTFNDDGSDVESYNQLDKKIKDEKVVKAHKATIDIIKKRVSYLKNNKKMTKVDRAALHKALISYRDHVLKQNLQKYAKEDFEKIYKEEYATAYSLASNLMDLSQSIASLLFEAKTDEHAKIKVDSLGTEIEEVASLLKLLEGVDTEKDMKLTIENVVDILNKVQDVSNKFQKYFELWSSQQVPSFTAKFANSKVGEKLDTKRNINLLIFIVKELFNAHHAIVKLESKGATAAIKNLKAFCKEMMIGMVDDKGILQLKGMTQLNKDLEAMAKPGGEYSQKTVDEILNWAKKLFGHPSFIQMNQTCEAATAKELKINKEQQAVILKLKEIFEKFQELQQAHIQQSVCFSYRLQNLHVDRPDIRCDAIFLKFFIDLKRLRAEILELKVGDHNDDKIKHLFSQSKELLVILKKQIRDFLYNRRLDWQMANSKSCAIQASNVCLQSPTGISETLPISRVASG